MKTLYTCLALTVLALLTAPAHAQFSALFDINSDANVTQTINDTFTSHQVINGSASPSTTTTVGGSGISLQLSSSTGSFLSRTRGALAGPYSNLYRDFAAPSSTGGTLTAYLSNLAPNTIYDLTLFIYDPAIPTGGNIDRWTDVTPGGTGNSIITPYGGPDPSNNLFNSAFFIRGTSRTITLPGGTQSNGLIFNSVAVGGNGGDLLQRINGIGVTLIGPAPATAPEPGTLSLLALGVLGGALARRRMRKEVAHR